MRRGWIAWASWRRIAIVGLALFVALLVLGSSLPDPGSLSAAELVELRAERPWSARVASYLPLGKILVSPWLLAVPAALGLAILWNVGTRLRQWAAVRRARAAASPGQLRFKAVLEWESAQPPFEALSRIARRLRRQLFAVELSEGALVARRGAAGFWGSIAFHLSLVLLLAAVGLSIATSWQGELLLAEGQDAALDDPASVRVLRKGPFAAAVPHVVVTLTKFTPRWLDDEFPLDYRAEVVSLDGEGHVERGALWVNQPLEVGGQRLYLTRYGMAPYFEVKQGNRPVLSAHVSLTVLGGKEDSFEVPGTGVQFSARYLGAPVRQGRHYASRTDVPKDPAFELRLLGDRSARPVLVRKGEEADVGPFRVAFPELRYWVVLGVDSDPASPLVIASLFLSALGLLVRLWDHDREIRVRAEPRAEGGTRVAVGGRSRYFPALMERELEALRSAT